jgi:hypothetical protein
MSAAVVLSVVASGLFLMAGLLTGVWKYAAIMTSPRRRAPHYVDVAHRAALMYSFAALVLAKLAEENALPAAAAVIAALSPLVFFGSAIARYIGLALEGRTDNQYERRDFVTTWGMAFLILAEVGGVGALLGGYVVAQL